MNPKELKTALKPIVKELVYECLVKEGILSSVVSEVVKGMSTNQIVEQVIPQPKKQTPRLESNEEAAARRKKLEETLMSKIGVNVFEGTKPLAGVAPDDPGVDISGLLKLTGGWKQL